MAAATTKSKSSRLIGKDPKLAKPSRPRIVVFGAAGVGKTWTALDFPSCYYVDCEGGANLSHYTDKLRAVDARYVGPEDGANDFDTVLDQVHALSVEKHDRKTVIVDSFSKLFNTEIQIEFDRITATGKEPQFAIEKKPAIAKTRRLIRRLDTLDMNAILICHERALWQGGEEIGRTYDGWDKLGYELNLVLQVFTQGNSRVARVIKSRFDCFAQNEIVEWTYGTFRDRFGADVLEAESVSVEPAKAKDVTEAKRLVDLLHIDPATVNKWFDKAGVTDWDQMDAVTIAACIAHMTKQLKG